MSTNLLEESAVSDDVVSAHVDEICSEKYFTVAGLTILCEKAIKAFNTVGLTFHHQLLLLAATLTK